MPKKVKQAKHEASIAAVPVDAEKPDPKAGRRALIFFGVVVLLVLLVIPAALYYNRWSAQQRYDADRYNGFNFVQLQEGNLTIWVTTITVRGQQYEVPFYYHPRDTLNVPLGLGATDPLLKNRPNHVYLTFPLDAGGEPIIAGVEVARLTGYRYNLFNINTSSALNELPAGAASEFPVITCQNSTKDALVLSFTQGTENRIDLVPGYNCVRITYTSPSEAIRVSDRYAYALLRIQ